ncbi:Lar family restriction alleviation protein [Stenotrophomonas maltophilia]|uniref:Lar family restriction alleviation protein n=1 Tax=Stenotrophomonas maltophilia TaxID=40324 RepID=UPI0026908ECA
MSEIELKACPFCGDWGAECAESAVPSIHGGQKRAVYCNSCFCEGPTSETDQGACEAWNNRAPQPQPQPLPAPPEVEG